MTDPAWTLTDPSQWSLDFGHLPNERGTDVRTCSLPSCRLPIRSDEGWLRLERGSVLGASTPHPERIAADVDLHHDCYVPWMAEHHPRFVDTRVA